MPSEPEAKAQESTEHRLASRNANDGGFVPHRTSWPVEIAVYLMAFFAPLALGSAHLWAAAVLLLLATFAFGMLVFRRRAKERSYLIFPMGIAFLMVSIVTLIQLIPLPEALLGLLSPHAADLREYVGAEVGLWGGGFSPLSLDAPATARELVRFLSYTLTFLVVVNYFNDRHRARRLLKVVAWSGFLVALVGFFSKLFVADQILGFHPVAPGTFFFATFVNPNHLAGFLGLCSPVALGLALTARDRQDKALFGFMGIIIGVAVFMTLSRGAMVAYPAGILFLLAFVATRRARRLRRTLLVQVALAGVLALAGYLAYDTILRELRTLRSVEAVQEDAKIRSWEGTLPMMADHPVLGIGRGAYASVYPRYKSVEGATTFTHAENEVLQNLTEWGPIFGGLFILTFAGCFLVGLRKAAQSMTMGGCLAGIFGVSLHNLVDFNLEIGGVALPFVMVLGVIAASPFSHADSPLKVEAKLRVPAWLAKGLVPAAILAGALCVPFAWRYGLAAQTQRLLELKDAPAAEPCSASPLGTASCSLLRHQPADYLAPLTVGKAFLDASPAQLERAAHWLSKAMWQNPTAAVIHRLTGRALLFLSRRTERALGPEARAAVWDAPALLANPVYAWIYPAFGGAIERVSTLRRQAFAEYRLAAQWEPGALTATTTEVLRITNDPAAAIEATPQDGRSLLLVARNLRTLGREEAAVDAARKALAQDPSLIEALDLLGDLALQDDDLEEAALLVKQALEVDPLHDRTYLLQGKILLKRGRPDEAERAWQEGLKQIPDSTELAFQLVEFYLAKGRILDAEEIAGKLQNFAPTDDGSQARLQALFGRIYETKGMLMEARRSYLLASALLPSNPWYLFKIGSLEERMGNWDEAERIYKQLLAERFNPQLVQQRIAQVQQARDRFKQQAFIDTLKQGEEKPEQKTR